MKPKILIVDDDRILLQMAQVQLSESYEVLFALSGEDALLQMEEGLLPDLILLDIDMPNMNGYETLEKMKVLEKTSEIPVIFLTGFSQEEDQIKGLKSGAVDYITKPFHRDILLARIALRLEQGMKNQKLKQLESFQNSGTFNAEKLKCMETLLSEIEFSVGKLMALGYTNEEIAHILHYSYYYIKKVVAGIFSKLEISRRFEIRKFFVD